MSARPILRSAGFILTAILAVTMASEAQAEHRQRRRVIIEDQVYAPSFFERIPGVRTLFGDYALTEDEYNELYGPGRQRFDESYYEPEPVNPAKPKKKPAGKQGAKPSAKPAAKASAAPSATPKSKADTTASVTPKTDTATTSSKTALPAPAKGVSCEKATSIVSEFGFTGVTPQSCSGKVYAFNATRGGKSFAIKVDPASGELTEVKKLQ